MANYSHTCSIRLQVKKVLLTPSSREFADISYLEENFKPHLLPCASGRKSLQPVKYATVRS